MGDTLRLDIWFSDEKHLMARVFAKLLMSRRREFHVMTRNLGMRAELLIPVEDPPARQWLEWSSAR